MDPLGREWAATIFQFAPTFLIPYLLTHNISIIVDEETNGVTPPTSTSNIFIGAENPVKGRKRTVPRRTPAGDSNADRDVARFDSLIRNNKEAVFISCTLELHRGIYAARVFSGGGGGGAAGGPATLSRSAPVAGCTHRSSSPRSPRQCCVPRVSQWTPRAVLRARASVSECPKTCEPTGHLWRLGAGPRSSSWTPPRSDGRRSGGQTVRSVGGACGLGPRCGGRVPLRRATLHSATNS